MHRSGLFGCWSRGVPDIRATEVESFQSMVRGDILEVMGERLNVNNI